jgi:hypothetical protein
MSQTLSTPATVPDPFEAESLALAARHTSRVTALEPPQPTLRSFALILARCQSAATLLGWRKQISPTQKQLLDGAIQRLQQAAAQVPVRASVPPTVPRRAGNCQTLTNPRR